MGFKIFNEDPRFIFFLFKNLLPKGRCQGIYPQNWAHLISLQITISSMNKNLSFKSTSVNTTVEIDKKIICGWTEG